MISIILKRTALFCKLKSYPFLQPARVHLLIVTNDTFISIGWIGASFIPFQTNSPEVMFEYLLTLARVDWINQLQGEMQNISQKDPNMAKQLVKMFNASAYETKDEPTREIAEMFLGPIDDFKELFESHIINILHCTFLIFAQIFSTTIFIFLIHYEKFGTDPMKRSLSNQLFAQIGWIAILDNLVIRPIWIFRILIGPINPHIVETCITIRQAIVTWYVFG